MHSCQDPRAAKQILKTTSVEWRAVRWWIYVNDTQLTRWWGRVKAQKSNGSGYSHYTRYWLRPETHHRARGPQHFSSPAVYYKLVNWSKLWRLQINLIKYHVLPIRAKSNENTFSRNTLNGSPLSNFTLTSDLGVFGDSNLTFKEHMHALLLL